MIRFSTFLFFLAALLLSTRPASAQATRVAGKVTYNGIRPLANVALSLDGTYDGATTNDKGEFSFATDEKGRFTLVAKAAGFVDMWLPIDLTTAVVGKLAVISCL